MGYSRLKYECGVGCGVQTAELNAELSLLSHEVEADKHCAPVVPGPGTSRPKGEVKLSISGL